MHNDMFKTDFSYILIVHVYSGFNFILSKEGSDILFYSEASLKNKTHSAFDYIGDIENSI